LSEVVSVLDLGWGLVADARVEAATGVEYLDVLEERGAQFEAIRPATPVDELALERGEEALATALSQQLPLWLMLTVTPRASSSSRYSLLVY